MKVPDEHLKPSRKCEFVLTYEIVGWKRGIVPIVIRRRHLSVKEVLVCPVGEQERGKLSGRSIEEIFDKVNID